MKSGDGAKSRRIIRPAPGVVNCTEAMRKFLESEYYEEGRTLRLRMKRRNGGVMLDRRIAQPIFIECSRRTPGRMSSQT